MCQRDNHLQDRYAAALLRMQAALPNAWEIEGVVDIMSSNSGETESFHFDVVAGAACLAFEDPVSEIYDGRYYDEPVRLQTHVDEAVRMIARPAGSNHARLGEAGPLGAAADILRAIHRVPDTDGETQIMLERPDFA